MFSAKKAAIEFFVHVFKRMQQKYLLHLAAIYQFIWPNDTFI